MRQPRSNWTVLQLLLIICQSTSLSVPKDYNLNIRPSNGGTSDVINVSLDNLSIREVDEEKQKISVDFVLHTFWEDKRLVNLVERETVFAEENTRVVWTPHLSIVNSHGPIYTGKVLSLKPDGTVDSSDHVSVQISCQMSMMRYPFGKQHCKMQFVSHGYSSIHLILLWNGIIPIHNVHIFDPEYSLYNIEQSSERQKSVVGGGEFSYINVEITLRRSFPAQLIAQALFPTLFFAALAYFTTFFMDRNEKGKKNSIKSQPAGDTNTEEEDDTPNPQQVQVEIENSTPTTILYKISFDILKVGANMFFLLIVVLVKQINFLKSPRSSQLNALDVWMGVMSLIIFICFVLSLQICCRKWIRIYRNRIMVGEDLNSVVTTRLVNILRILIPVVFLIFLIAFIGFCFS